MYTFLIPSITVSVFTSKTPDCDILSLQPLCPKPELDSVCGIEGNSAADVDSGPVLCFVCECGWGASLPPPCHTSVQGRGGHLWELKLLIFYHASSRGLWHRNSVKTLLFIIHCISLQFMFWCSHWLQNMKNMKFSFRRIGGIFLQLVEGSQDKCGNQLCGNWFHRGNYETPWRCSRFSPFPCLALCLQTQESRICCF